MATIFPFLTSYDPPGTSEGTLDPLGLYQIADQLAVQLVPAVRERMQRIRFLTAMAVGALVTEGLEDDPRVRDASPYLVWEWLVVEALIREMGDDPELWGVPGTLVTRRALDQHGYLDARSYLKTPRVFGFHGVYKRLATHLGIVNVHLTRGRTPRASWMPGREIWGSAGWMVLSQCCHAGRRQSAAVLKRSRHGLSPAGIAKAWAELAEAFAPSTCKAREKRYLRDLLHAADDRRLGALPTIWQLQASSTMTDSEKSCCTIGLKNWSRTTGNCLQAIRAYEGFARSLQDAFDVLKAEAARLDAQGFAVPQIASDADFRQSV